MKYLLYFYFRICFSIFFFSLLRFVQFILYIWIIKYLINSLIHRRWYNIFFDFVHTWTISINVYNYIMCAMLCAIAANKRLPLCVCECVFCLLCVGSDMVIYGYCEHSFDSAYLSTAVVCLICLFVRLSICWRPPLLLLLIAQALPVALNETYFRHLFVHSLLFPFCIFQWKRIHVSQSYTIMSK